MTSSDVGSFVSLIMASALVITLILVGIPGIARIVFHFRVEAVRDECMDAILAGRLRPEPSVQSFIRSTEEIGARARRLTLLRAAAVYVALVQLQAPRTVLPEPPSYDDLEPNERALMGNLEERYQNAFWSYLNWGSPIAWLIAPLLRVIGHRIDPASRIVRPRDAVPALTYEAAVGREHDPISATAQWLGARHVSANR